MNVEVRGDPLTEASRSRLNDRLDFALGRLGEGVSRVWVHIADQGRRCRVLVRMRSQAQLLVEGRAEGIDALLAHTVRKAGLAVRRELARRAGQP